MRSRSFFVWALLLAALACGAPFVLQAAAPPSRKAATPGLSAALSLEELQRAKLAEEVRQLAQENASRTGAFWQRFGSFATLFLAIAGTLATLWRQIDERGRDRREKRADKFASLVTDLGAERAPVQAGAAVGLQTFLRDEYREYHEQVFLTLVANLRLEHEPGVHRLLVRAFEQAFPLWLRGLSKGRGTAELDLAGCRLPRVDLSVGNRGALDLSRLRLDLKETCLAGANLEGLQLVAARGLKVNLDGARLANADLTEARLHEAHLFRAHLNGARLVSAKLKGADLREAQLQQAKLQSAHLDGHAKLAGACFEQADLNDTFFHGARFDETALRSILRAKNWQRAHFDPDIEIELKRLAATTGGEDPGAERRPVDRPVAA